MFRDRAEAGRRLAERLAHLRAERPVVLALPRGGVPVAYQVAVALAAPLDIVLVRKIGVPWQPELAAAAVVDGEEPQIVENADVMQALGLGEDFIEAESKRQLDEIERRRRRYLAGRARIPVEGRTVIVVDDGIATGATARAALKGLRRAGAGRLVLAVPVAPPEAVELLRAEADEVVCPETPAYFGAISMFFADFHQVGDDEVVETLARAAAAGERIRSQGAA